jgi:hypothetical protein
MFFFQNIIIYVVSYLNCFIRLFAIYFNLFLMICKKIRCSSLEIENSFIKLFAKTNWHPSLKIKDSLIESFIKEK